MLSDLDVLNNKFGPHQPLDVKDWDAGQLPDKEDIFDFCFPSRKYVFLYHEHDLTTAAMRHSSAMAKTYREVRFRL